MPLLCIDMKEIHGISEGSIVEVTDVARSTFMGVGDDDIVSWLKEGVRLEVRRIKPDIRTSKVTVTMSVVDGQDIPSYRTVVSSTYESWPNGCSRDCHFDADGHTTHYGDKYFDVEVVE